jgi:hypothetical protein
MIKFLFCFVNLILVIESVPQSVPEKKVEAKGVTIQDGDVKVKLIFNFLSLKISLKYFLISFNYL